MELCRYVVLNPLRVKARQRVEDWRWSSYRATAGLAPIPGFLTVDWVLGHFGQTRRRAQARYRAFVRDGLGRRPWEELQGQIYLGSEGFIQRVRKEAKHVPEVPRTQRQPTPTLGGTGVFRLFRMTTAGQATLLGTLDHKSKGLGFR